LLITQAQSTSLYLLHKLYIINYCWWSHALPL